jgi:hypothetical protein
MALISLCPFAIIRKMVKIISIFVAVKFAVALMPSFRQAINAAALSWPANSPVNSSFLTFIPSPVDLAFSFLIGAFLVWLLVKGLQPT